MSTNKGTPAARPDSMLVEPDHIVSARQDIGERGSGSSLEELAEREPVLATYIHECMASLAGKLALSGAPTQLVQGIHQEALALVLSSVEAQRRGHFDLWKDSIVGTRLESLVDVVPAPPAPPEPRATKKKKPTAPRKRPPSNKKKNKDNDEAA